MTREEAEAYFREHGLPWFLDGEDERVARLLHWRALVLVFGLYAVFGLAAGVVVGLLSWNLAAGLLTALVVFGLFAALYLLGPLRGSVIARWAVRRTLSELSVMVPLVTRALPMLLLFTTFLFINTEVWQVASSLERNVLALAVILFSAIAVAFLLSRLPEELGQAVQEVDEDLVLSPRQKANLLLVLLIGQALQVLILSLAVWLFFIGFGLVAIDRDVVHAWLGHYPQMLSWDWDAVGWHVGLPVSNELFQVAVFLAGFSGLYFTVYAVSDATYREQFFTRIAHDLRRAVEVRAAYQKALD